MRATWPLAPIANIRLAESCWPDLSTRVALEREDGGIEVYHFLPSGEVGDPAPYWASLGGLQDCFAYSRAGVGPVVAVTDGCALATVTFVGLSSSSSWEVLLGGGLSCALPARDDSWGQQRLSWRPKGGWQIVAVAPDMARFLTAGKDQRLRVVELATQFVTRLDVTVRPASKAAFSLDGLHVATCQRPGVVKVWDARDGRIVAQREIGEPGVSEPVFVGRDRLTVQVGGEGLTWMWRVAE